MENRRLAFAMSLTGLLTGPFRGGFLPPARSRAVNSLTVASWSSSSRYTPHQGRRECARRVRQMEARTHGF